jgi:hypothetical protein
MFTGSGSEASMDLRSWSGFGLVLVAFGLAHAIVRQRQATQGVRGLLLTGYAGTLLLLGTRPEFGVIAGVLLLAMEEVIHRRGVAAARK